MAYLLVTLLPDPVTKTFTDEDVQQYCYCPLMKHANDFIAIQQPFIQQTIIQQLIAYCILNPRFIIGLSKSQWNNRDYIYHKSVCN